MKRYYKLYFSVLSIMLIIFFIVVGIFYYFYKDIHLYDYQLQRNSSILQEGEQISETTSNSIFTTPIRTNGLLIGLDKSESLTDVIMVGSFVSTTGEINMISVPRDTYTVFGENAKKIIKEIGKYTPKYMKINSVYSFGGGGENGVKLLDAVLEDMLGIKIDYYAKVDLDAFKYIVDTVGGIYFDVPKGGLKYSDPTQDLYINLKEGYQLLNGEEAEGLVRFRKGYVRQDIQRVEVQQEFIKAFIKQVFEKDTIIKNIGGLALNFIKYVKTDFSLSDLPKYISVIPDISTDNIKNQTLEGYPKRVDRGAYYILDREKIKIVVDEYFYGINTEEVETISKLEDDN